MTFGCRMHQNFGATCLYSDVSAGACGFEDIPTYVTTLVTDLLPWVLPTTPLVSTTVGAGAGSGAGSGSALAISPLDGAAVLSGQTPSGFRLYLTPQVPQV